MIRALINLYMILIIIDTILSYLPQFRAQQWAMYIKKAADFTLNPVRKYMPKDLPVDVSPVVLIVALMLIQVLW